MTMELLYWGDKGWGDEILIGALITIALAICSFILGLVIGLAIALAKTDGNAITRKCMDIYTTIIRGVPEIIIIYLLFFGSSSAIMTISSVFGYGGYIEFPPFAIGTIAIGMISGAYSSEVFRGAIKSIHKGQYESAYALGMCQERTFKYIILPQALRHAIPGLGNIWQLTLKDTALISVTGLAELMRVSRLATNSEREPFLFFITAACVFLVLTALSTKVQFYIEAYYNRGQTR